MDARSGSRAHSLLCDAYHEFGVSTAPFDDEGTGVGNRFIGWPKEELDSLMTAFRSLMGYSALVTHKSTLNVLVHEGCPEKELLFLVRWRTGLVWCPQAEQNFNKLWNEGATIIGRPWAIKGPP